MIFFVIGLIYLSSEINKLVDKTEELGFFDFFLGLGLLSFCLLIFYKYPVWWVNILLFPLLFISTFGALLGIIKILTIFFISKSNILVKISVVIAEITAFIGTVLSILKLFEFI